MHQQDWEKSNIISSSFVMTKRKQFFDEISDFEKYNLIDIDKLNK